MLIGIFDPLGAQTDRLRCEVCQNLILSPMNTGLLRPAVATALTVYGIETPWYRFIACILFTLQQRLPFTVLKLSNIVVDTIILVRLQQRLPFTVLKLFCFNIGLFHFFSSLQQRLPFTVLKRVCLRSLFISVELQQRLPFTVLKLT